MWKIVGFLDSKPRLCMADLSYLDDRRITLGRSCRSPQYRKGWKLLSTLRFRPLWVLVARFSSWLVPFRQSFPSFISNLSVIYNGNQKRGWIIIQENVRMGQRMEGDASFKQRSLPWTSSFTSVSIAFSFLCFHPSISTFLFPKLSTPPSFLDCIDCITSITAL